MDKLNWSYDQTLGCEVAEHNGFRIRAVVDEHPENPFEEHDCEYPITVQHSGRGGRHNVSRYEKHSHVPLSEPLTRFNDAQLVHDQIALAKLVDYTIPALLEAYGTAEPVKYCHDADELRWCLGQAYADEGESDQFELYAELYTILGIPALVSEVHGHSQGDWARVLAVATPEAREAFGSPAEMKPEDLQPTIDLYAAWAFGDVYGYVIERPVIAEDGDVEDWEEIEDGSCWGYYGPNHDKSGLEEAALDAVPDEAVSQSDKIEEAAHG